MVAIEECTESPAGPELLARAQAGDGDAFCLLIEPLQARLLRQAIALSGNPATAEDLVSETMAEAWKSLGRYNRTCRLSTWLYAILMHRRQKTLRRSRRWPQALSWLSFFDAQEFQNRQENFPSSEPSPAQTASQNELFVQLRRCVEVLPEKHRQVIWLRFFEDASMPDMAAVLHCSVGTIKSRLHHALEKLRKMKMNLPDLEGDEPV